MSYDLTFLPKPADRSWAEVLAAVAAEPAGLPDPRVWQRLVAGARQVLGDVDVFGDEDHLGRVVEAVTGFTGYDPQLELPLGTGIGLFI
jgi:hypothetical protein